LRPDCPIAGRVMIIVVGLRSGGARAGACRVTNWWLTTTQPQRRRGRTAAAGGAQQHMARYRICSIQAVCLLSSLSSSR
jgi:hypothetical protein